MEGCVKPPDSTKLKGYAMDFTALKKNLEKNRFAVSCFDTTIAATDYLAGKMQGETVGFGGSVTLKEMGLYERLEKNNTMFWHWVDPEFRNRQYECSTYVTSVNGMAETGEIVNIDGSGNRLACSLFGPKKVYFVVGANKISPDLNSAIERARNVASPLNAQRMNIATPCVKDGRCHDCNSPARICNSLVVHLRPMFGAEHTEVVLVDEKLGY